MALFQHSPQRMRGRHLAKRLALLLLAGLAVLLLGGRALLSSSNKPSPQPVVVTPVYAGADGVLAAACLGTQQQLEEMQRRNKDLEGQVAALKQQLGSGSSGGSGSGGAAAMQQQAAPAVEAGGGGASSPYLLEPIDMARLLGPLGLLQGASTQQQHCFPPWKESVPDAALVGPMVDKLKQQLADALAPVATQATEAAPLRLTPLVQLAGSPHVDDPRWRQLDRLVTRVLARFALHADGSRACKCGRFQEAAGSPVESINDVGTSGCTEGDAEPDDAGVTCLGSLSNLLLGTPWGSDELANALRDPGVCTAYAHDQNFGRWWVKERLYNPDFQNFDVKDKQEDTVLELFDLMYERNHVFLKQRWMGFTMMQDPFDLLGIQMLLYDVRPAIILETGTANGGSALLWASILEVLGLEDTRIHTVDVNDPSQGFGSADPSHDPTQHKLWKKYVTFHKGRSTDVPVLAAMAAAAEGEATQGPVLVLLDSDHSEDNVASELQAYAPFVTVGSYCIVEDTKLSRFSRYDPGPLAAVRKFLEKNAGWRADRSRELFYTQHVMGYLRRTA